MANRLNQMRSAVRLLGSTLLLAMQGALASAPADWEKALGIDPNVAYEATSKMNTPVGEYTMHERRAAGMQAVQMNVAGIASTIILRDDRDVAYMLLPAMNLYREVPQDEGRHQAQQDMAYSSIRKLGRDTIAGHAATKYEASFQDESGSGTGLVWVTDSGVLAKVDMQYGDGAALGGNFRTEMTELIIGKQELSHFEVPTTYKPMNVGALMGMLGAVGTKDMAANTPESANAVGSKPKAIVSNASAASASDSASDSAAIVGKRPQPKEEPSGEQTSVASELSNAANEVAGAAKEEARSGFVENTRDRVREGIRGLFGRKKQ